MGDDHDCGQTATDNLERAWFAERLLSLFRDEEPCQFDHHGNCQSHGMFDFRPEFNRCPMVEVRELLG